MGQVTDMLARLRNTRARGASRTSVMTLIVDAMTEDEARRSAVAMRALGGHHPARLITVRPAPDSERAGVDARVALWDAGSDRQHITFDQIELSLKGEAAFHLESIIEPLTLPDLPVVVWYPGKLPSPSESLLSCAAALVVDTKEAGDQRTFAGLLELIRTHTVVDLSWARLRPWRELLAALFDGPSYVPFASHITSIEVEGKAAPRHLLAGWLFSRLGTPRSAVHLGDAQHVSVRLSSTSDGRTGRFSVIRRPEERLVRASVNIEDGPSHSELLPLPDDSLAWSLARALTHLDRDRVWEDALSAAVVLDS
jgi:glucose-6-phosphate dehydrogenase assembly protein OpcA